MNKALVLSALLVFTSLKSFSLPVLDQAVKQGDLPIEAFPDHLVGGLYWYVPQIVEPVIDYGAPASELDVSDGDLLFTYRGRPAVTEDKLEKLAKFIGVPRNNLKPIFFDSSKMNTCANSLYRPEEAMWMIPEGLGNFMEVFTMGIRVTDPVKIPVFQRRFEGKGIGCVYQYTFSGVYTAYSVSVVIDYNRIYERINAEAHAEGLWWETDLKSFVETLHREGYLKITEYQNPLVALQPGNPKVKAAFDDVLTKVIAMIFTPALNIHDEPMVGRGRPWSLRADYRKQSEFSHFAFDLQSQAVQQKTSTISVRVGLR